MAKFTANAQFDINDIDLNWYSRNADAFGTVKSGVVFEGVAYPERVYAVASDTFTAAQLDFFGSGFITDASNNITGGVINVVGETDYVSHLTYWYATGLSINAAALYQAGLTASNTDEISLIAGALGGDDTIVLSAAADVMKGFSGHDYMAGNAGNDVLDGGDGNDLIDGGTGADTMIGGAGNDGYMVDQAGDIVVELAGGGIDSVSSSVSFTLGADVENLQLSGGLAINGSGNALDNYIGGNAAANTLDGRGGADMLVGGAGNDTYLVDSANDVVTEAAGEGVDTVQTAMNYSLGANLENLILTGSANLVGKGNELSNSLTGNSGANTLTGGGGSDALNGGAGYDTAVYSGSRHSYTITVGGGAVVGGPEGGVDSLTSVERLQFVDGYFSTETGGADTAASVYRLYQTMLNRAPDSAGLASWVQTIDVKGVTLKAVANGFIDSTEFKGTYGALSNDGFVERMYLNVLGRGSDGEGKATWMKALADGQTRADVAIGFSQSAEFVNKMSEVIDNGIWVANLNAGVAARFYDTVFSRRPDVDGLNTWTKALDGGASLSTVANGFVASKEFQATYGSLNNDAFVELMYHNVLGRGSDASGKATWVNMLNGGGSRADVVVGFSESAEHVRLLAPHIDDGVWVA